MTGRLARRIGAALGALALVAVVVHGTTGHHVHPDPAGKVCALCHLPMAAGPAAFVLESVGVAVRDECPPRVLVAAQPVGAANLPRSPPSA